ncbi:MAG TPA: Holliday junction resolvase [Methanomicrobiales archaeon]|jgi:Holliday junction resolvase|nr:Holliday junction resolvase [Methanomicrobiales archaeon]
MSDFEREMVACLNRFFETGKRQGFAYRLKQHKWSTQYVDVLVDSLDPRYYCAIECKSIRGRKLYFSQHFHSDRDGHHQVDAIGAFLARTGRRGYLAIEFRFGSGKSREAYLIPWEALVRFYRTTPGIGIDEFRGFIHLERTPEGWLLPKLEG